MTDRTARLVAVTALAAALAALTLAALAFVRTRESAAALQELGRVLAPRPPAGETPSLGGPPPTLETDDR